MFAIYARVANYYDISKLKDMTENFLIPSFANPFSFFFFSKHLFHSLTTKGIEKNLYIFLARYTQNTRVFLIQKWIDLHFNLAVRIIVQQ